MQKSWFLTAVMAEKSCCVSFAAIDKPPWLFFIAKMAKCALRNARCSIYYENQARYGIILNVL